MSPQASGWAALENKKDTTLMTIRVGVNMLQSLFSLQLLLTRKTYNKVRGTYFSKEVFARLYSLRQYVFSMYICIVVAYDYTTPFPGLLHFTIDPYLIMPSVKEVLSTIVWVFDITWARTEPKSLKPLVNTLTNGPIRYRYRMTIFPQRDISE